MAFGHSVHGFKLLNAVCHQKLVLDDPDVVQSFCKEMTATPCLRRETYTSHTISLQSSSDANVTDKLVLLILSS